MSCPSPANWGALKLGHTLTASLHGGDKLYRVVGVTKRRVELAVVDCGPVLPAWFKRCDPRLKGCTILPVCTPSAGLDGLVALCGDKAQRPSCDALPWHTCTPGLAPGGPEQTQDGGDAVADGFTLVRGGVFKSAAAEVLRRERRLMTTGHITRRALELGLLGTLPGKTPDATMASTLYTDVKPKRAKGRAPVSLFVRPSEGLFGLRCWGDDPVLAHLVIPASPAATAPKTGANAAQSPGLRARAVNGAAPGREAAGSWSADQGCPPSPASSQGAPAAPRVRPGTPLKNEQATALRCRPSDDVRTASEDASAAEQPQVGTPLKRARTPSTRMLLGGELDGAADPATGDGPDGSPLRSVRRRRTALATTLPATRSAAAPAPGVLLLLQAAEALGAGHLPGKMQQQPIASELPATAASIPVTPVYKREATQPAQAPCPLLATEALPSLGDAIVARLTPVVGLNDTLLSCALWSFSRKACSQGRAAEADAAAVKAWTHFCRATCGTAYPSVVTPEMFSAWHAMTADVARLVPLTAPC